MGNKEKKINEEVLVDPEIILRAFVTSRIKAEFAYYKLIKNLICFKELWGLNEVLCTVDHEENLIVNF